jgi:hypothetical protein
LKRESAEITSENCPGNPPIFCQRVNAKRENASSNGSKIPQFVYFSTGFISISILKREVERNKAHVIPLGVIPQLCFL